TTWETSPLSPDSLVMGAAAMVQVAIARGAPLPTVCVHPDGTRSYGRADVANIESGREQREITPAEAQKMIEDNPSCHLLKSMGFYLTLRVKSPISPQEEPAHGRQNYRNVLPV